MQCITLHQLPAQLTTKLVLHFRNNGINWIKRGNPIISTQFTSNPTARYGAGQAQLRNTNGQAAVTIWHTDTPTDGSHRIYERTSTNGINFSAPRQLSRLAVGSNTPIFMAAAGISLSPSAPHDLYMIVRDGTKTLQLYKIPFDQRFTGRWTKLGKIIPGPAGGNMAAIFEPGFRTDMYGNLWSFEFPTVWVGMGCGPKYLDDAGVDPTLWQLCQGFPE